LTTPVEKALRLGTAAGASFSLWEAGASPQRLSTARDRSPSRIAPSSPLFTLPMTMTKGFL
jgi:hypothetical protein